VKSFIYKATDLTTGKCYIGRKQCKEKLYRNHEIALRHRIQIHYADAARLSSRMPTALKRTKPEDWQWDIIEFCAAEKLNEREVFWINYFDSTNTGYNVETGGLHALRKHNYTDEERQKRRSTNHRINQAIMRPVRCIETGELFESCYSANKHFGTYGVWTAATKGRATKGMHFEFIA
jgi:group I intron endonuclease